MDLRVAVTSCALLASGCQDADPAPAAPPTAAPLEHDFGTIPHGQAATHTFALPIPGGAAGHGPVAFQSACSCAVSRFLARNAEGRIRDLEVLPFEQRALQTGEELLLELTVQTKFKEGVDQPRLTTHATAVVRNALGKEPNVKIPVVFHYAIDAPIAVRPVLHVDFGAIPRFRKHAETLELHPDRAGVTLGPVTASDPRLTVNLRTANGVNLLDLVFVPGEQCQHGPVQVHAEVATSLPDHYILKIPITGQILPDIVIRPFSHVSFGRLDLRQPREQFVLVTDHDDRREPEFVDLGTTDSHGRSLTKHFTVRLEPVPGDPRTTRVVLQYLGTLAEGFRGTLRLGKAQDPSVAVPITFVGFALP